MHLCHRLPLVDLDPLTALRSLGHHLRHADRDQQHLGGLLLSQDEGATALGHVRVAKAAGVAGLVLVHERRLVVGLHDRLQFGYGRGRHHLRDEHERASGRLDVAGSDVMVQGNLVAARRAPRNRQQRVALQLTRRVLMTALSQTQ